jgi:hypothetical protein
LPELEYSRYCKVAGVFVAIIAIAINFGATGKIRKF